jgi:sarcosine oxidase, subunit gamma
MEAASMADAQQIAFRDAVLSGRVYARSAASVAVAPPMSRLSLRAPKDSIAALSKVLGLALPQKPKTSAANGALQALWLGPDEWMILASDGTDLAKLCSAVTAFHSAVDVSHRNAALVVEGEAAANVINAGCPQNLSLAAFPINACSRTLMGKTEIILFRTAESRFHIEVWRSFAAYAFDFLEDAIKRDV